MRPGRLTTAGMGTGKKALPKSQKALNPNPKSIQHSSLFGSFKMRFGKLVYLHSGSGTHLQASNGTCTTRLAVEPLTIMGINIYIYTYIYIANNRLSLI